MAEKIRLETYPDCVEWVGQAKSHCAELAGDRHLLLEEVEIHVAVGTTSLDSGIL